MYVGHVFNVPDPANGTLKTWPTLNINIYGEIPMTENTAAQCCNGNVATEHAPTSTRIFTPRVDIIENETGVLLYADLPGVRPEDVDLRFEQGELTLIGKVQPRTASGRVLFAEYELGDFQRVFQVPDTIDAGKIDAEFKNGVLIVRLPKQEVAKPKQVQIRVNN